jgi:hypothetical protein
VVADEADLPEIWHQWANCTKRQELQILNKLLYAFSRGATKFSTDTPVVSPKLIQDLLSFTFVAEATDDIKTGIQPFVIVDGTAEHRRANLELSQMYSFLASGETALQFTDLELLKSKETMSVPLTYFELEQNLGMFGNFLGVVLGVNHPITTSYREFWDLLTQTYRSDIQQIIDIKNNNIRPAHILRSLQLNCHTWFKQKKQYRQPTAPDFVSILHNLELENYLTPYLPPSINRLAVPRLPPQIQVDPPSLAGSIVSGSSGSDTSVVSGLTTGSGSSTGTQRTPRNRGTYQINLHPDHSLHQLLPAGVKLKDLIGSDPPPAMDNGTQICLSYFCTAGCWSNCGRIQSHGKTLNQQEKARLVTYLQAQAQKIQARQAPVPTPPANG